jgi:hypothetical protein
VRKQKRRPKSEFGGQEREFNGKTTFITRSGRKWNPRKEIGSPEANLVEQFENVTIPE